MRLRLRRTLLILFVSLRLHCSQTWGVRARINFSSLLYCCDVIKRAIGFEMSRFSGNSYFSMVAKKRARKDIEIKRKKGTQREDKLRERTNEWKKKNSRCTFSCMPLFSIDFVGFSFCIRIKGKKFQCAHSYTYIIRHTLPYTLSVPASQPAR